MTDRHSIVEARRNLPELIREAENGKEVELTRRGKPVAMLSSYRAFKHQAPHLNSAWLCCSVSGFHDQHCRF